jgi:hypothetical protein
MSFLCFLCEKGFAEDDDLHWCPNCKVISMHEKCGVELSDEEVTLHRDAREPSGVPFLEACKCQTNCAFNIEVCQKDDDDEGEELEV